MHPSKTVPRMHVRLMLFECPFLKEVIKNTGGPFEEFLFPIYQTASNRHPLSGIDIISELVPRP